MKFDFLANHPQFVPTVARWYFDQWGYKTANNSYDQTLARLQKNLSFDQPPLAIVGLENDIPKAAAQLKIREMTIFPEREFWLGSVYVAEEVRGHGVGEMLVEHALERAHSLGIKTLYLYTSNLSGGLYARKGFLPVEQVYYDGKEVLVMQKELNLK